MYMYYISIYLSCMLDFTKDLVKQFKNKTKLERRQSVAVMETIKSPRGGKPLSSQIKSSKSGCKTCDTDAVLHANVKCVVLNCNIDRVYVACTCI